MTDDYQIHSFAQTSMPMPWCWSSAVKDAHDDVLADGDCVMLIKD